MAMKPGPFRPDRKLEVGRAEAVEVVAKLHVGVDRTDGPDAVGDVARLVVEAVVLGPTELFPVHQPPCGRRAAGLADVVAWLDPARIAGPQATGLDKAVLGNDKEAVPVVAPFFNLRKSADRSASSDGTFAGRLS